MILDSTKVNTGLRLPFEHTVIARCNECAIVRRHIDNSYVFYSQVSPVNGICYGGHYDLSFSKAMAFMIINCD